MPGVPHLAWQKAFPPRPVRSTQTLLAPHCESEVQLAEHIPPGWLVVQKRPVPQAAWLVQAPPIAPAAGVGYEVLAADFGRQMLFRQTPPGQNESLVHPWKQSPFPAEFFAHTAVVFPPPWQSALVLHDLVQMPWLESVASTQVRSVVPSSQSGCLSHDQPARFNFPGTQTVTSWLRPRLSSRTVGLQKKPAPQSRTVEQKSRHTDVCAEALAAKAPLGQVPLASATNRHSLASVLRPLVHMPLPPAQLLPCAPVQGPR